MAKTLLFSIVMITTIVLFSSISYALESNILSPQQEAWLNKNNRTITIRPQKSYAPFIFVGSGTVKNIKGLSAEYIEAIAKKLNIKIVYTEPAPFADIIRDTKEGATDVVLSVSPTDDLGKYFYFTDSYITMPAVIVTRKDFKPRKTTTSLNDFSGEKVAIAGQYPVESYVLVNYPKVIIEEVSDDQVALQKLLLGEVSAAVMDQAALSYYTSNDVLSYVKAVGRTGFEYKHSIAVPKTSPELLLILDTGLKSLSDAEKQVIINKWIDLNVEGEHPESSVVNTDIGSKNLTLWLIFFGFIVLITATVITVITLRKAQFKTFFNRTTKKETISEVQEELKELQMVHESLKEEMEHVSALEEDIEKKIHSVE